MQAPKTLRRGLLSFATAFLFGTVSLPDASQGSPQAYLDNMDVSEITVSWMESAFGSNYIVTTGDQVIEGYTNSRLESLCTAAALASNPVDRTMTLGEHRTPSYYKYAELGLTFVFLDSPSTAWEVHLTSSDLSLNGVTPGMLFSDAKLPSGLPRPYRIDATTCKEEWDFLEIVVSCPEEKTAERVVRKVIVRNPDLPSACWFSFMGSYK